MAGLERKFCLHNIKDTPLVIRPVESRGQEVFRDFEKCACERVEIARRKNKTLCDSKKKPQT